jgi:hypothetical protein
LPAAAHFLLARAGGGRLTAAGHDRPRDKLEISRHGTERVAAQATAMAAMRHLAAIKSARTGSAGAVTAEADPYPARARVLLR